MDSIEFGFEFQAMGTACRLRLAGCSEAAATAAADAAIAEVRRIETKYSRYRDDSIVSRINAAAGSGQAVPVDGETADLLDFAARLHDASGGLFDITTGVLRRVWDFRAGRLPLPDALAAQLARVGWRHVRWERPAVELTLGGMELDFGGFGKEYAADRAGTLLLEHGVPGGLVNLGGDIRVIGPHPDGNPWSLGIAHPREPGAVIATITLHSGGLATSGDYERFFEFEGRRYCHILDPRSGWPVQHWRSVSVVAPACLAAGALSTIAMLSGAGAQELLRSQGVGFLTIDADNQIRQEIPE
ncbi:FAD:protein FMN transferase [Variovorax sp. YR752]|uniref:FAD:protein FMN transferase n=1 Tax=Variovorax sp. YR752 TaxID=1884383 RepID=UPI003137872B